jgi:hypothetical protein
MNDIPLKDREFKFLVECIERAAGGYLPSSEIPFYTQVVSELIDKGQLTTADLTELEVKCGGKTIESRAIRDRMTKFSKYLVQERTSLSGLMAHFELTRYPMIEKVTGGGHAKMNRYELNRVAPAEDTINTLINFSKPASKHEVQYSLRQLTKTPWWLHHLAREFNNRTTRLVYLAAAAFVVYGLPMICFLLIMLKVFSILEGVLFAFASTLLSQKLKKVIDLLLHKIAELDFSDMSLFALSVVTENSRGLSIEKAERRIVAGVIRADCPVCLQKYGIKNSVIVERKHAVFGSFIGKCLQNPQEHRFSFDKDLMVGEASAD